MEKFTTRNFMEAVINNANGNGYIFEDAAHNIVEVDIETIKEFAANSIAKLNESNAKASARTAKKRAEDPVAEAIFNVLTNDFQTIADISAKVEIADLTSSKVASVMRMYIEAGKVEKQEVTIPATETTKSRKAMAYKLIEG
jgi:hypothetical protein